MFKLMSTKVDWRAEVRFQENFLGQKSINYQLDLTSLLHLKVSTLNLITQKLMKKRVNLIFARKARIKAA